MTDETPRGDLDARIDAIESAYEYFLAYAAQGRRTDRSEGAANTNIREHLENMHDALDGLGDVARSSASLVDPSLVDACAAFLSAIDDDAAKAKAIMQLVLAQQDISSQLIDNVNASIHVRALLTDLFIIDEASKR